MVRAFLPGTFDPIHNGHIDLIHRASLIFDEIIVVINPTGEKSCLFSVQDRLAMAQRALLGVPRTRVLLFEEITASMLESPSVQVDLAGLRVFSDFDRQFLHSITNMHTAEKLDLVGMIAAEKYTHISSNLVREIASLGGDVSSMVPDFVVEALRERYAALDNHSL
jgi:pantetheine-phosphate adenylyltransferase